MIWNAIGPSSSGNITLGWNIVEGAISYSIYRSSSPITDMNGLTTIITGIIGTIYRDTGLLDGNYFYVVVASNAGGDSPISNSESVVVALIDSDRIAGFPPVWFGVMMLGGLIGIVWNLRIRRI